MQRHTSSFRLPASAVVVCLLLLSCSTTDAPPCERFFEPYPDLNTGRQRTEKNAGLVDAMAHYTGHDYAAAVEGLKTFIDQHPQEAADAYLYLANCFLALGRPYDAELQLDHLEQWPLRTYQDETDWYNALCLVCSGQHERALEVARAIAASPRHAYKQKAQELVSALDR